MKKIIKVLTCFAMCFSFTGCFSSLYSRNTTNNIESTCNSCKEVNNIDALVDNLEYMMNKVNAVKGTYSLTNTKQTFNVNFEAITREEKVDWDLHATTNINDKDVTLYLKDEKFYVIYPNNGANVILKDNITDLVKEAEDTLDKLNATYQKDNLHNIMLGDKLEGFVFDDYREKATYTSNSNGTYTMYFGDSSLEWEFDITSNFLISEARCEARNFTSVLKITYPQDLTINYPMGLDFLTVDIADVKKILEIESFAELIDEDLKTDK